ncbi:trigger factor [Nitrospirillum amazonense]|uniref:Trigger factor n=1 Tax=Nitrospirillum amazonense TaxID=28077 RepID=A0A560KGY9_9PROT|nr:trigger factor [Nitrospirillum amazonense]TWB82563.1 trigger factor [Nitrospirillum amazonense]
MNITETSTEGLRREYTVVIPAADVAGRVDAQLKEIGKTVRMPGFRPGKVPMSVLKQRYGQSVMGEVLDKAMSDSAAKVVEQHSLRPALQPKVEIVKFEVESASDLEFKLAYEVLPEFEPADLSGVAIEKPVVEITDEQVDEAVGRIAAGRKTSAPLTEDRPAAKGDIVVIDFDGSVDGEKRPGMKGEGHELELGSGSFIDTFEEQLEGTRAGDHRTVNVTFPEGYHAAELAGKAAVFEVDVKEVKQAVEATIDDEFAKGLGFDDLAVLKTVIRDRLGGDYTVMSRLRAKRALLDQLAELHSFEVPQGMVDIEFDQIWKRLQDELKAGDAGEDAGKDEEELRKEYRDIAVRRVRLGLVLSEIGQKNNITVAREELNQAVLAEVRRYPGQEREVFDFFKNNPQAVESLRAPVFEDKVVDFILGQVKVTEKPVSAEELMQDPDEEEAA